MNNQREIDDNESNCLDLIEETLIEDITNYEIIKTEDIYDEDEDIVYRAFILIVEMKLTKSQSPQMQI